MTRAAARASKVGNAAIARILDLAAYEAGLEPAFVRGMAFVESRWDPKAESRKGARGLLQLMPSVCADYKVTDAFDPVENARGGCQFIAKLLRRFDVETALHAYNWGPRNVLDAIEKGLPVPPKVQVYANRVLDRARLEMEHPTVPFAEKPARGES